MQYITYIRVSTDEQGRSGLGLEAQLRDIGIFLEMRPGEVLGEFKDIGSGGDNDRPEFVAAVALAKRTGATLVVAKLDRLSRRVSKIATLMEEIHFKVASMPDADEIQLHIYAALAQQERKFVSERTKKALAAAKARGTKLGGWRGGSMQKATAAKKQTADRNAQRVAGLMLPLRDSGLTLQQIADKLNATGVETARGASWDPKAVSRVLARVEVVGEEAA